MRITVTYEYSNGKEGVMSFETMKDAYGWLTREGDYLIDYVIYTRNK